MLKLYVNDQVSKLEKELGVKVGNATRQNLISLIKTKEDFSFFLRNHVYDNLKSPAVCWVNSYRKHKIQNNNMSECEFVNLCDTCAGNAIEKLTFYFMDENSSALANSILACTKKRCEFYNEFSKDIGINPIMLLKSVGSKRPLNNSKKTRSTDQSLRVSMLKMS